MTSVGFVGSTSGRRSVDRGERSPGQTRSSPVDTSTGKHRRTIKPGRQSQNGIPANQVCLCPSHDEAPHVRSNPAGDREEQSRGPKVRKEIRAGYLRHGNHRCCGTRARYGQQRLHALRGWLQNLTADLAEGPNAPCRRVEMTEVRNFLEAGAFCDSVFVARASALSGGFRAR
jgi:hypothetical protein